MKLGAADVCDPQAHEHRSELDRGAGAKVNDGLIPRLRKLPGFSGYFLVEVGDGIVRSPGLLDTSSQAENSTRIAAGRTQEEKLEKLVPNPPEVSLRKVIAHETKAPALV
jgi:hypothetical protein